MESAAAVVGVASGTTALVAEISKVGRTAANHIKGIFDYAKDLEDNYKKLKWERGKLSARRDDIKNAANRRKEKQFTEECKYWISRVENQEKEVQELEIQYSSIERNGTTGEKSELSKRMVKKCDELQQLWSEGIFERGTLVDKPPERVITMHAPKIEDGSSLHPSVEKILSHLSDPDVRRVGLWGIIGVGKTTIMQNVNNNEDIAKMFDIVIWLTVSKDWSIQKLQRAITQRLKLNVEDTIDPHEIALRISTDLKCKKYLLLLDEVWKTIDLSAIGIYDNPKDSKVVLATRDRRICEEMDTCETVNAQPLSENDAYKMFREKVGRNVNLSSIEPIVRLVARECGCLPLLIDKVARAFKSKKDNYALWKEGLSSLRKWPNAEVQGMNELIEVLKFCYDELGAEDTKVCFLYGALYPENCEIHIDHLLECWKAEGFIHDANDLRVAHEKGQRILHDLILRSLLEGSDRMNYVRMNKVLRNMALHISSKSNNLKVLVRIHEEQRQHPNEVEWQHVKRISLMNNELCLLPEKPNCENLSTLFLQKNHSLKEVPISFFELMKNLRVLDLHDTRIASLPSSISCLTCLRALYLNSCILLRELPCSIKKLTCLEILDIRGTGINYFPIQIGSLENLKCLRLSLSNVGMGQSSDVEFGKDVLSRLVLLEELRISGDTDIQKLENVVKAITQEVASLKLLTSLSICFPGVDCLENFISTFHLWKDNDHFTFQFSVGHHDSTRYQILDYFECHQIRRCLKFVNGEGAHPAISAILAETDAFELISHKGPSKLSDFGVDNINRMRGCLIEGCDKIETLVDGNSITKSALIMLEEMHIIDAASLTNIWEGVVHAGSLALLKTLTLSKCLKLKKIFSSDMIRQLSKLQNLRVEKCPIIQEIIVESENSRLESLVLPNLKVLELLDLEQVKSIWIDDSIKWPSLVKVKVYKCPSLSKFPFTKENAINLRSLDF